MLLAAQEVVAVRDGELNINRQVGRKFVIWRCGLGPRQRRSGPYLCSGLQALSQIQHAGRMPAPPTGGPNTPAIEFMRLCF